MPYKYARLKIVNGTGTKTIYPLGSVATDDLIIYANKADAYPHIDLLGGGDVRLYSVSGALYILNDADAQQLVLWNNGGTEYQIYCAIDAADLYLRTTGTGKIKFGTHTGTGDVAVNGYIPIKDAAGNARKLATVA